MIICYVKNILIMKLWNLSALENLRKMAHFSQKFYAKFYGVNFLTKNDQLCLERWLSSMFLDKNAQFWIEITISSFFSSNKFKLENLVPGCFLIKIVVFSQKFYIFRKSVKWSSISLWKLEIYVLEKLKVKTLSWIRSIWISRDQTLTLPFNHMTCSHLFPRV